MNAGSGISRNTVQRALVLEAVQSLKNHPTSADVYELVSAEHPRVSRATVYRNLSYLAQQGEILHIKVPDGADRYDFRTSPHSHVYCHYCGSVADVDVDVPEDLIQKAQAQEGFDLESCHVYFEGVCSSCSKTHSS